jgi:hypothetical protein
MAVCPCCKGEMTDPVTRTCLIEPVLFPDGETLPQIPFEPFDDDRAARCHDCNVVAGGMHHPGCDMERCPRCQGQLIGCGCLSDDSDSEEDEERSISP